MIYLDHAATSFPKPPEVLAAMQRWFTEVGVGADRGDGPRTRLAAETVEGARRAVAATLGVEPAHVAFVSGATEGLNLALRAVLRRGMRVVTTSFEHSSVVRPLLALADERDLSIARADDEVAPAEAEAALLDAAGHAPADVLVFTHASNVTGACFDARAVCALARARGVTTVLDASQTAGLVPLDVGADVVVASGHKALHGPPGIGFVAARDPRLLPPQKQGGTGSSRALERHPVEWPQAFEAGTPNTPAIFGLGAALAWVAAQDPAALLAQGLAALDRLTAGLASLPGVRLLPPGAGARVPVASFVHAQYDPLELGSVLAGAGVHARTGFHCAPWVHGRLGTDKGGTVRISPGPATGDAEIDAFLDVVRSL